MPLSLRVAVLGPESSGKSTLVLALADRLERAGMRVACVDEYARSYYASRPYLPSLADVEAIALAQCHNEDRAALQADIVLCDTSALTCRIWAEVAFGGASETINRLCRNYRYGLTLLARPDIPWQADPLRSHPHERDWLLGLYRQALATQPERIVEVYGTREQRLEQALRALDEVLPSGCVP
ncbi:ATP-binding protein [Craterilacuibacter sp. RT1T]|uniref:AAA family ATPase n=1 Tax=Craterilacuibacter sp. RT1T TaxID=2942211 RepID=UPI0020BFF628|nr:ATP-binding protein [Craterilacuibacter sp. RT1T]MCL6263867.1 ATP-binding protein [Craterilacuibacter sp. RT1T]